MKEIRARMCIAKFRDFSTILGQITEQTLQLPIWRVNDIGISRMSCLIVAIIEVCCPCWSSFPTHFLNHHPTTIGSQSLTLNCTHVAHVAFLPLHFGQYTCTGNYRVIHLVPNVHNCMQAHRIRIVLYKQHSNSFFSPALLEPPWSDKFAEHADRPTDSPELWDLEFGTC